MARTKGSNEIEVSVRREMIMLVMGSLRNEGQFITTDTVHQRMQQVTQTRKGKKVKPYSSISRATIGDDMKAINVQNSFVRDLSQYHYSALKENIFSSLQWIYNQAKINYEKTWTQSKTITRETKDGEYSEEVTTAELAQPKAAFLNIMKDATKEMNEILDAKTIQVSVALLSQRLGQLEQVETEHETLKKNYENLLLSKNK